MTCWSSRKPVSFITSRGPAPRSAKRGWSGYQIYVLAMLVLVWVLGLNIASHLIVTVVLAMIVFLTVLIYGFYKNGLKFFKLFVPSGIPIFILPLVVFIEVFSFFLRPICSRLM